MNRKKFINLITSGLLFSSLRTNSMSLSGKAFSVQLIRHATLLIRIGGTRILVDPMLSAKDALDPIGNSNNLVRFPMVDLPLNEAQLKKMLRETDAVFITHTHRDHWDAVAQSLIDKDVPLFCQPPDLEKIKQQGFTKVIAIESQLMFRDIKIDRTGGQHGTGDIGQRMGEVSGFVFTAGQKSLYVAGDTIWCDAVADALNTYKPTSTVLNTGGAQFLTGDPITMTPADVMKVKSALPETQVIAVHMDTVNHCHVKRVDLKREMENAEIKIEIPEDGQRVSV